MSSSSQWLQLAASALVTGVALYGAYYLTWGQYGARRKPPNPELIKRLERRQIKAKDFDEYELAVLADVILPEDIEISFKDIGGYASIKQALYEAIVLPVERPDLFKGKNKMLRTPKGILFYGPPGTGKSMMAKAVARDSGATFVNVNVSTLMDKYVGESEKLMAALFSLARKLAPTIIFIDEIDGLLGRRRFSDHQTQKQMKSQFLALWDGISTSEAEQIIVLGATNRPNDLDPAILRRLPRTFQFSMPDFESRLSILHLLLDAAAKEPDVRPEVLADLTPSYSGSDLAELCKYAALVPLRDLLSEERKTGVKREAPRPLRLSDFEEALAHVRPSGTVAESYEVEERVRGIIRANEQRRRVAEGLRVAAGGAVDPPSSARSAGGAASAPAPASVGPLLPVPSAAQAAAATAAFVLAAQAAAQSAAPAPAATPAPGTRSRIEETRLPRNWRRAASETKEAMTDPESPSSSSGSEEEEDEEEDEDADEEEDVDEDEQDKGRRGRSDGDDNDDDDEAGGGNA